MEDKVADDDPAGRLEQGDEGAGLGGDIGLALKEQGEGDGHTDDAQEQEPGEVVGQEGHVGTEHPATDYILAPEGSKPTVQTAQYSLTCLARHPGDHTAGGSAKIENVFDACTKCHNGTSGGARPILPGAEAHHPMKEMSLGEGAPEVSGAPSPHLPVKDCTNCHVEGHKYEATQAACDKCHGGKKTIEAVHNEVLPKMEALKAVLDQVKAAHPDWDPQAQTKGDDQKAYELAYTLYTFAESEGSGGVHNYDYTYAILNKARDALVKVGLAAPEALPITGAALVNLWPYLAGMAGVALVGVGIRKRMR